MCGSTASSSLVLCRRTLTPFSRCGTWSMPTTLLTFIPGTPPLPNADANSPFTAACFASCAAVLAGCFANTRALDFFRSNARSHSGFFSSAALFCGFAALTPASARPFIPSSTFRTDAARKSSLISPERSTLPPPSPPPRRPSAAAAVAARASGGGGGSATQPVSCGVAGGASDRITSSQLDHLDSSSRSLRATLSMSASAARWHATPRRSAPSHAAAAASPPPPLERSVRTRAAPSAATTAARASSESAAR